MARLNDIPPLAEIEALLSNLDIAAMPSLRIAVLRAVTVESIEPYLRYESFRLGFHASIKFGQFDNLIPEALDGAGGLLTKDLDVVLIYAPLEAISRPIARSFVQLGPDQLRQEVDRLEAYCDTVIQGIRRQTGAMILWHGMEPPLHPAHGILDAQLEQGQAATIASLNDHLRAALSSVPNAYLVDMAACLARLGGTQFYDSRFWHLARAPYTRQALAMIASEDFKFVRALKGARKKCLVLDCDDTLWGGIVGEEGLAGIKVGRDYPGSAYLEFQEEILSLYHRGIIIALCSKNNEEDVWEVFDNHPEMLLRREHIAAWRINWRDKATNIRELADELNIGLDSMVLVDDSTFETGLVRARFSDVSVIELPRERPVDYRAILSAVGLFDAPAITAEDRNRGKMYQAESIRRQAAAGSSDIESYYESLDMRLEIGLADELSIPRIAQQTQKTNQFNLTTRRYSEGDVARFAASSDYQVVWLRVVDKLGDSGIVGTCVLMYVADRVRIDTLLLSCRALGRGIETKFLEEVLHLARCKGARTAIGEYIPSRKNAQVETFFTENGFDEIEVPGPSGAREFTRGLETIPERRRGYFAEISSPVGVLKR